MSALPKSEHGRFLRSLRAVERERASVPHGEHEFEDEVRASERFGVKLRETQI